MHDFRFKVTGFCLWVKAMVMGRKAGLRQLAQGQLNAEWRTGGHGAGVFHVAVFYGNNPFRVVEPKVPVLFKRI